MNRNTQGFTLIEVLVAVVVLAAGLLGVAGTMLTAARNATSNYLEQQGVQQAYDIVDRMRANRSAGGDPTSSNPYIVTLTPPAATIAKECTSTSVATAGCTASETAAYDIWQWQTILRNTLPDGLGQVSVAASGPQGNTATITVTVQWSDQPAQAIFNKSSTTRNHTYTVVTAI